MTQQKYKKLHKPPNFLRIFYATVYFFLIFGNIVCLMLGKIKNLMVIYDEN